ncbi:hypothetical protein PLESTF_001722400 [Pleodorina starrii]|nr:hypothetical protein PLESTF_001722400 [Pleodorina starrii]
MFRPWSRARRRDSPPPSALSKDAHGGAQGADGDQSKAQGTTDALLAECGLHDMNLKDMAVLIATLGPKFKSRLDDNENRALAAASASMEEMVKLQRAADSATAEAKAAREAYVVKVQACADASTTVLLQEFDDCSVAAARAARVAVDEVELQCLALKATADEAVADARMAASLAMEAKERAVALCEAYRRIKQASGQLKATLGGDEAVAKLPDLLRWAEDFVEKIEPEQWSGFTDAATADGYRLGEHVQALAKCLPRLLEQAIQQQNESAFRLSQQIVEFSFRIRCSATVT